ncbi:MAG: NYN domain-containing protein [Candidatus Paceibacterota bacterium]|jgi:uncharacterized LabA/DUF88 family protein
MKNNEIKKLKAGIFIDGSNLLWSMKSKNFKGEKTNYDICFEKLFAFLHETYSPVFCNYYVCEDKGAVSEPYLTRARSQGKFFDKLGTFGYSVIRKNLKHVGDVTKCDTDVEIVMDMHRREKDIDLIVLFSGDSDFRSALQHFHSQGKFIHVYSFANFLSWELREFTSNSLNCGYTLLGEMRGRIERVRVIPGTVDIGKV